MTGTPRTDAGAPDDRGPGAGASSPAPEVRRRSHEADRDGGRSGLQVLVRTLLGAALTFAGLSHLTSQREEFRAQVPAWVPLSEDLVVVVSGVIEIALGLALLALLVPPLARHRTAVGLVVAAFFVVIFPGNVAQWTEGRDAFGLDTDGERLARLFFQPVLVLAALWSTGAWRPLVDRLRTARRR